MGQIILINSVICLFAYYINVKCAYLYVTYSIQWGKNNMHFNYKYIFTKTFTSLRLAAVEVAYKF